MVNFKFIARFLALVIVANTANAGFQSMRPPPGYSRNPVTGNIQQPGWGPSYKAPPGEFYDMTKKQWMSSAQLNTGGRDLAVPVSMPLATGVNVGLAVASAFSSNPAILLGTVAWALYQAYLAQKKITPKDDGTFEQVVDGLECSSNCFEYSGNNVTFHKDPLQAGKDYAAKYTNVNQKIEAISCTGGSNPVCALDVYYWEHKGGGVYGWSNTPSRFNDAIGSRQISPYSNSSTKTIPPSVVATEMAQLPMSKPLVDSLPMPLPVNPPVVNPDSSGQPQVLRLPQGSPVPQPLPSPNPNNIPQTWKTPVVDVIPSPTPDDPWRVETIPKDITKTAPSPVVDPLNPNNPLNQPAPKPEEDGTTATGKTPSLCQEYPDILACAKPVLDTPDTPQLETKPRQITYSPDQGWGSGGACPAPRHLPGANVDFEFTLVCDFMSGIKPVLLTVASLVAGMILIGARGGAAD